MFCKSLFVLLSFFFRTLYCWSFFVLRILITTLVSSNISSCTYTIFRRQGVALWYMCIFVVFISCVYTKTFKLLALIGILLLTFPVIFWFMPNIKPLGCGHFKLWRVSAKNRFIILVILFFVLDLMTLTFI